MDYTEEVTFSYRSGDDDGGKQVYVTLREVQAEVLIEGFLSFMDSVYGFGRELTEGRVIGVICPETDPNDFEEDE